MAGGVLTLRGTKGQLFSGAAPQQRRSTPVARGESTLTLRGTTATLLLGGYREAVWLSGWAIYKVKGRWRLKARIARLDPFHSRQRPLVFTAPRPGGFWAWPIESDSLQLGERQLIATLGPPER